MHGVCIVLLNTSVLASVFLLFLKKTKNNCSHKCSHRYIFLISNKWNENVSVLTSWLNKYKFLLDYFVILRYYGKKFYPSIVLSLSKVNFWTHFSIFSCNFIIAAVAIRCCPQNALQSQGLETNRFKICVHL